MVLELGWKLCSLGLSISSMAQLVYKKMGVMMGCYKVFTFAINISGSSFDVRRALGIPLYIALCMQGFKYNNARVAIYDLYIYIYIYIYIYPLILLC